MHDSGQIEVPSPTDLLRLERADNGRTPGNAIARMTSKQLEDLVRSADIVRVAAREDNNVLMGLYQVDSDSRPGLDIGPRMSKQPLSHYDLFTVDLETGNSKSLATGVQSTRAWLADEQGFARARIDTDADSGRVSLFARTEAGGSWREVFAYGYAERGTRGMSLEGLSPTDPNIAYVLARTGSESIGAYEYDLRSGTIGRSLVHGPSNGVDRFLRDPLSGRIIGVVYFEPVAPIERFNERSGEKYTVTTERQPDAPRLEIFEPEWQTLYAQVAQGFPGQTAVIASIAADHKTLIVFADGGEDRGGAYYFVDLAQARSWKVGARFKETDTTLSAVQSTRFHGRDGLLIPAQIVMPGGRNGQRLPLVVLLEGTAEAGSLAFADWRAQVWAHSGYAVLQPQFRGPDGMGSSTTRRLSTPLLDDVHAAVAQLGERGLIDTKRVCFSTNVGARDSTREDFGAGAPTQAGGQTQLSLCQSFAAY
jgi:dipeptidyl aminopeptidase/acylaminoacyl peptidase